MWLVLLGLPLFSTIEIGNIRIQKEVEQTRAEVKESIGELRLQILDLKIANSNYNTLVVNNQPLPSKDELSQLQNNIPSSNSQTRSETTNFNISDNNIYSKLGFLLKISYPHYATHTNIPVVNPCIQ